MAQAALQSRMTTKASKFNFVRTHWFAITLNSFPFAIFEHEAVACRRPGSCDKCATGFFTTCRIHKTNQREPSAEIDSKNKSTLSKTSHSIVHLCYHPHAQSFKINSTCYFFCPAKSTANLILCNTKESCIQRQGHLWWFCLHPFLGGNSRGRSESIGQWFPWGIRYHYQAC